VLLATGDEQEASSEKVALLNSASPIAIKRHTVSDTDRNSKYMLNFVV
jgi:hypothetical protein